MGHTGMHADTDEGRIVQPFHNLRFREAEAAELVIYPEQAPRRKAEPIQNGNGNLLFFKVSRKVQQTCGHKGNAAIRVTGQMDQGGIDQCHLEGHISSVRP